MLRTIIEEGRVTESLQKGSNIYPRTWEAYEAMCWLLVRREVFGAEISGVKDVYKLHKQAAGGFGVPQLSVLYTVTVAHIHIHTLRVG